MKNTLLKKIAVSFNKQLIPNAKLNFRFDNSKNFFKVDYSNRDLEFQNKILNHSKNIIAGNYIIFNKPCNVLKDGYQIIFVMSIVALPFPFFKALPQVHYNLDFFALDKGEFYKWDAMQKSNKISINNDKNADIKVPWEIGRMHELVYCALAYKLTGTDKHYEYVISEIKHFANINRIGFGPQWMSGMDVSIRLINLLFAFDILNTSKKFPEIALYDTLERLISNHADFINYHSEWSEGMRGNHYLTNLTAMLIFILHSSDEIQNQYLDGIIDKFITELNHQFYDDGGNFESSTYYHALSAELVIWAFYYLSFVKDKIEPKKILFIQEKVFKIYEFLKIYTKKDGSLFQIGDNDGGHILNFPHYDENENKSYLIDLFEFVLNINPNNLYSNFLTNNFEPHEIHPGDYTVNSYGLVWASDDYKFVLRNGKKGQNGKGGHDHSDQNSIMLEVDDAEFLVDPGTFSYTGFPDERNKFRSINYHNTLVIDDTEQYHYLNGDYNDLFWAFGEIFTNIIQINSNKYEAVVEYAKYKKPMNLLMNFNQLKHTRTVEFMGKKILIKDSSDNNYEKKLNLHFAPKVKLNKIGEKIIAEIDGKSITIKFPDDNFAIFEYDYSKTYGVKEVANKCVYSSHLSEIYWEIIIE